MTIKPLLDRVVLKVEEAEEKTKSGIILHLLLRKSHSSHQLLLLAPAVLLTARK